MIKSKSAVVLRDVDSDDDQPAAATTAAAAPGTSQGTSQPRGGVWNNLNSGGKGNSPNTLPSPLNAATAAGGAGTTAAVVAPKLSPRVRPAAITIAESHHKTKSTPPPHMIGTAQPTDPDPLALGPATMAATATSTAAPATSTVVVANGGAVFDPLSPVVSPGGVPNAAQVAAINVALGGPVGRPPNSPSPLPSPLPSPALNKNEPQSPQTPGTPFGTTGAGTSGIGAAHSASVAVSSGALLRARPAVGTPAMLVTPGGSGNNSGTNTPPTAAGPGASPAVAPAASATPLAAPAVVAPAPVAATAAPASAPAAAAVLVTPAATPAPTTTAARPAGSVLTSLKGAPAISSSAAPAPAATAAPAQAASGGLMSAGIGGSGPGRPASATVASHGGAHGHHGGHHAHHHHHHPQSHHPSSHPHGTSGAAAAAAAKVVKKAGPSYVSRKKEPETIRSLKEETEYDDALEKRRQARAAHALPTATATSASGVAPVSDQKDVKLSGDSKVDSLALASSGGSGSGGLSGLNGLASFQYKLRSPSADMEEEEALDRRVKAYNPLTLVPKYPGKHAIVFCHGYQGNSWDMRLIKNQISCLYPDALCLLSVSNESLTEGNIMEMGVRLAKEVDEFIKENAKADLGRLSFVCHSLGGVITRAALTTPTMAPYLSKCYTYVSLATPHCGYLYSENTLLDTGIWVLKKWSKSECLSQLSLTDTAEPANSFLHQLSQKKGLEYFAHIFLLASTQDKYAPFHSARIELHRDALDDKRKGPVYHSMVANLLMPLRTHILKRFDVSFVPKKTNLDSLIGRTAHIYFLDQVSYMTLFINAYKHYFA